ncbi:hypothetical protein BJ741DRAFT_583686 [Chytriomyces cf. hyalinus JEL632]|nr:hypothetical protein BJ741DRAFT_583686 [Chytriomyces cf. hyalinus JEL632]
MSDYYKEAIYAKWIHGKEMHEVECPEATEDETALPLAHITKKRRTSDKLTGTKIRLNHPNFDAEAAKIVLDFLYLGDAEIPISLVSNVIAYADEILVDNLVKKCFDHLVKGDILSLENAFHFYLLSERIRALANRNSYALNKMLQDLPRSLQCGREVLAKMKEREIETLLLFEPFEPLDRLRILIAWCKVCQDGEGDISLESKLPENFPIEAASNLIKPLLPGVELLKIPATHSNVLEPFMVLLPEAVRGMLTFHLKGTTPSGGNRWRSDVLLLSQTDPGQKLMDIMRAIKQYLPVTLQSHNVATDPALLFHGNPESCSGVSFHKACDGHRNTLTLIKLKTGTIFGGFSGVPWTTTACFQPCTDAFMFLIAPSGAFWHLPWKKKGGITRLPKFGPAFGENFELLVDCLAMNANMGKEVFSKFNEGDRCAFIKQLSATDVLPAILSTTMCIT